jgi:hypothetical protein
MRFFVPILDLSKSSVDIVEEDFLSLFPALFLGTDMSFLDTCKSEIATGGERDLDLDPDLDLDLDLDVVLDLDLTFFAFLTLIASGLFCLFCGLNCALPKPDRERLLPLTKRLLPGLLRLSSSTGL